MSKIPDSPEQIFTEFVNDCQSAYPAELQAVVLYGSGARGEYVARKSDINFLVILTQNGIDALDKALPLVPKWRKQNVALPLFLTKEYILSSLDTFPLEFLDMKLFHKTVFGEDFLNDIQIEKKDLRLQLERELRGKLIYLRNGFLQAGNDREQLRQLLATSVATFVSIFQGLLHLKDVNIPKEKALIFDAASKEFGLKKDIFTHVLNVKHGTWHGSKRQLQEITMDYIHEIKNLVEMVDRL